MGLSERWIVEPGKKAGLNRRDPDATPGYKDKESAEEHLVKNLSRLAELQYLLYANADHALLTVFQAVDAGGKDGAIRHVMSGLNPQGTHVTSFKVPTQEEMRHDFLWRIHRNIPGLGEIGIFNRSHYEDVLVARVHKLVAKSIWAGRYELINNFEAMLSENKVIILKFFLHISKEEQKARFEQRLEDPMKQWKLSEADFAERKYWDEYIKAYEDALTRCSTKDAPWYVIPANRKWYRNLAVSQVMVETLESLKLKMPEPAIDLSHVKIL